MRANRFQGMPFFQEAWEDYRPWRWFAGALFGVGMVVPLLLASVAGIDTDEWFQAGLTAYLLFALAFYTSAMLRRWRLGPRLVVAGYAGFAILAISVFAVVIADWQKEGPLLKGRHHLRSRSHP